METRTTNCIREYVKHFYQGGLIGISDVAEYCHVIEGELYKSLLILETNGELKVIKRYFCPEFHQISSIEAGSNKSHCQLCQFFYPNNQLEVAIYIQPLRKNL
jgi:hypothetical protein